MSIKTFLKTFWKSRKSKEMDAHVHEKVYEEAVQTQSPDFMQNQPAEPDIDLSPQKDLENYARGLSVTKKSLEQLISSGMLMPDELEVAEKILRYMRNKDQNPE